MTALILLIICVTVQILIAIGLGIFFLRRHLQQRRGKNIVSPPSDPPSDHKE